MFFLKKKNLILFIQVFAIAVFIKFFYLDLYAGISSYRVQMAFHSRFLLNDFSHKHYQVLSSRFKPNEIFIKYYSTNEFFKVDFDKKVVYIAKNKIDRLRNLDVSNINFIELRKKDIRNKYIFSDNKFYLRFYNDVNFYKHLHKSLREKYKSEKNNLIGMNEVFISKVNTDKLNCKSSNLDKVINILCKRFKECTEPRSCSTSNGKPCSCNIIEE